MQTKLIHSDCLEALKNLPDNSVDSVVTDPPYGLSFMGKKWDYDVPSEEIWAECLRVLKPGGHLLAFAGTRTQHRMSVRIEDAGFEIRDMIAWVYGSGFPKSLDVSKAIDNAAGAEREIIGKNVYAARRPNKEYEHEQKWGSTLGGSDTANITAPATPEAQQWQGWGTALKPALEPITVARKPLIGTVAENVLTHGTGALNIDGCRVEHKTINGGNLADNPHLRGTKKRSPPVATAFGREGDETALTAQAGRWPANLIHDGSEEVLDGFPDGAPAKAGRTAKRGGSNWHGRDGLGTPEAIGTWPADPGGSAARFFYCPKASKKDRDEGLEGFALRVAGGMSGRHDGTLGSVTMSRNTHPTVKPTDLMRYLCRLVTPPNGTVLDPFMGSGSTGKAAMLEGFNFIGIEREAEYIEIAKARINWTLLC